MCARHVTFSSLKRNLSALGIRSGHSVEVHTSLSSFGHVEGGAETVITALKDLVGSDGALIMPAFPLSRDVPLSERDRALGVMRKIRKLDPDSDAPTAMGVVADTFKNQPDVKVGLGPFRVAAWGAEQDENARSLSHLHQTDGHGLLLGVDIYSLTSMHYVEHHLPDDISRRFRPSAAISQIYPEKEWLVEAWSPPVRAWHGIQTKAMENGSIKAMKIGEADCMFFKVNDVIGLYKRALQEDPYGLFGL